MPAGRHRRSIPARGSSSVHGHSRLEARWREPKARPPPPGQPVPATTIFHAPDTRSKNKRRPARPSRPRTSVQVRDPRGTFRREKGGPPIATAPAGSERRTGPRSQSPTDPSRTLDFVGSWFAVGRGCGVAVFRKERLEREGFQTRPSGPGTASANFFAGYGCCSTIWNTLRGSSVSGISTNFAEPSPATGEPSFIQPPAPSCVRD